MTFLGLLYENENEADGIHRILQHLQQYVPHYNGKTGDKYCEQGIVGDQLTVERGINGLMEVSNGFTPTERNEGMKFLEVGNSIIV